MKIVFKASKARQAFVVMLGVGFLALLIWWLVTGEESLGVSLFILLCIALCGLFLARGLYVFWTGVEQLHLDDSGFHAMAWADKVSWLGVECVYSQNYKSQKFICFGLSASALARQKRHLLKRLLSLGNSRLGYGELQVATSIYSASHEEMLLATLDAFQRAIPNVIRDKDGCWRPDEYD